MVSTGLCSLNATRNHPYFRDKRGNCHKYVNLIKNEINISSKSPTVFKCNNNLKLDVILANDLVADCGPKAEDEPLLLSWLEGNTLSNCENPYEIPCIQGHSKCYSVTKICMYKIDDYSHNFPCRNGGDLVNCKKFKCNLKFKCANSYCIPWEYVCDGKWDCPFGDDEIYKPTCINKNTCIHMYKCHKIEHVCIYLGNVCDNGKNCPLEDDEFLCQINNFKCPLNCECLALAIFVKIT